MTTAEQKHTRGPWQVDREYDVTIIRPTQPSEGNVNRTTVARIQDLSLPFDESYANSLLIAAAPEMAQALGHLETMWAGDGYGSPDSEKSHRDLAPATIRVWRECRAALQKAGLL